MAGKKQGKKELFWGWVFFAPTLAGLLVLNIIPIFQTIYKSFFQTGAFGRGDRFVGFANYMKMFSDSQVWQSLLNTFVYAILEVPISILISLVLAALLNRKMKLLEGMAPSSSTLPTARTRPWQMVWMLLPPPVFNTGGTN